jgi:cell division protein FtsZ
MTQFPNATRKESPTNYLHQPVLKVLGLGGGGSNAVARMMELGLRGMEFIAANTDHQALQTNPADVKIQLGPKVTRGLGAGGDPAVGKAAAEESWREIAAALKGADMVFLTAGMGGGTGTGSIPVAAKIARSLGAVTIAIVTTPFSFEMGRRQKNAREGLERLRKETNTLISIANDQLLYVAPKSLTLETAFCLADDVLRQSVEGISELITQPGLINVDFAHIKRLIQLGGGALMSIGHGQGKNKARDAVEQALHHPLLENVAIENAAGVIVNFTGGQDLTLNEVNESLNHIQQQTGNQAEVVMGVINDDQMDDRVQVILVMTGLGAPTLEEAMSSVRKPATQEESKITPPQEAAVTETTAAIQEPSQPVVRSIYGSTANGSDLAAMKQNLDIPAFMRRQARFAG